MPALLTRTSSVAWLAAIEAARRSLSSASKGRSESDEPPQLLLRLVQRVLAPTADDDPASRRGEQPGNAEADPCRPARDEYRVPLELHANLLRRARPSPGALDT